MTNHSIQAEIQNLETMIVNKAETQQQNIKSYAEAVQQVTQNNEKSATAEVLNSIEKTVKSLSTNISVNEELVKENILIKKKPTTYVYSTYRSLKMMTQKRILHKMLKVYRDFF